MKKKFFKTMLVCLGILGSCYTTTFAMEKADVDLYYLGRNAKLDNAIYVEDNIYTTKGMCRTDWLYSRLYSFCYYINR